VKTYFVLLVQSESGPVKNNAFRKVVYNLSGDPKGAQGTLIQYLGEFLLKFFICKLPRPYVQPYILWYNHG
jgi:hypothetical protein